MDIALVRWPAEADKRSQLATRRRPRLLLVEPGAAPPVCDDTLEDWVRLPVADVDVRARVRTLLARIAENHQPTVDDTGLISFLGATAVLTPLQTRLMRCLVENLGAVVTREELREQGWPAGDARPNTVDVHVLRLRRRLAPLGLRITTVRSRGFVLDTPHT